LKDDDDDDNDDDDDDDDCEEITEFSLSFSCPSRYLSEAKRS